MTFLYQVLSSEHASSDVLAHTASVLVIKIYLYMNVIQKVIHITHSIGFGEFLDSEEILSLKDIV